VRRFAAPSHLRDGCYGGRHAGRLDEPLAVPLRFPVRGCAASRRGRTSETVATAAVMPAASTSWRC